MGGGGRTGTAGTAGHHGRFLVPTGTAREALLGRVGKGGRGGGKGGGGSGPAFPRDLLEGATAWEDGPELLHLSWELARCAPEAQGPEARALVLLAFCALVGVREGSTRVPVAGEAGGAFVREVLKQLKAGGEAASVLSLAAAPPAAVAPVLGRAGGEARPLLLEGDWLYVQRLHVAEVRLVGCLRERLAAPPVLDEEKALKALALVMRTPPEVKGKPVALNPAQQRAAVRAACRPLTVVTGGPGTGKTSVVVSMLRVLTRLGVRPEQVALAAPTGKAAMRMAESVRASLRAVPEPELEDSVLLSSPPEARTLHRLLGYSPSADRFHHHEQNPLPADVVIVDESSMVDLFMMDRLVRALKPTARLVLLGDADQLPSVDAGAVFRDLVAAGGGAGDGEETLAVRLRDSYRMDPSDPAGRNILTVARAVQAGAEDPLGEEAAEAAARVAVRARAEDVALGGGMELLACEPGDAESRHFLERWWAEVLRGDEESERLVRRAYRFGAAGCVKEDAADLGRLFARFEAARLLCLTRSETSPSGAGSLNAFFHAQALRAARFGGAVRQAPEFLPGEPVLVEQNDYGRGLFNGDQGLVVRGVEGGGEGRQHFMVAFRQGEGFVAFHVEGLRSRIRHAYAMTVHKSQGSEFERVALVLPRDASPLLTRELLYTGITRAKRGVVLVGAPERLKEGVARALHRFSGVAERLGVTPAPVAAVPLRRSRARRA
jgi:exodeoxyribonuclease V alpha subunit